MIERIKSALNSTITWFIGLALLVFFFWQRDKDLEDKLEATKEHETIKDDKNSVATTDHAADDATQSYEQLRKLYEQQHPND